MRGFHGNEICWTEDEVSGELFEWVHHKGPLKRFVFLEYFTIKYIVK